MPVSLRLPAGVEEELATYAARKGMSKSAVIVQSLQAYLAAHAQPSAHALYQEEMRKLPAAESARDDPRPRKRAFRERLRDKRAGRNGRA